MYELNTSDTPGLIRDMARAEQPFNRLRTVGVQGLRDEELLALAFRSRTLSAVEELVKTHSSKGLLAMPFDKLSRLKGIGQTGAAALVASAELARRSDHRVDGGGPVLSSMNDVVAQAIDIRDKKKEYLVAFFLNARQQLIAKEIISIGTLTASLAHPREIYTPAIGKAAAGVILVHNHPSGDPSPSEEDTRLTKRISQAGHIMGIDLLDHLIVASQGCYSFKQAGAL
jgi:DNA repair protein RadC